MTARLWLDDAWGDLVAEDAVLDSAVKHRQTLMSRGILRRVLHLLWMGNHDVAKNRRYIFLIYANAYSNAMQRKEKRSAVWSLLGDAFMAIDAVTAMVAYYNVNYALLAYRNAGGEHATRVPELFRKANDLAASLDEMERMEALGYLNYNVARWHHGQENVDEALLLWKKAAEHRFDFYARLKMAKAPQAQLLAAAQQLAKIRKDFPGFFPETPIDDCGLEADVYEELEAEYGPDLHAFAVTK